jgi:catechol 2,3-dioxygenase-like lactoylglutathione lyase family enzyme
MSDARRMQLTGLHHLTLICADASRSIAFYRDVLGLGVIRDGPSDDDPDTRHVWFGAADASTGQLISIMEYPDLPEGVTGRGSTHHFALAVDSSEELDAWKDYLGEKDVECSDIFERTGFRSLYVRDPDGHVVEIATRLPFTEERAPLTY